MCSTPFEEVCMKRRTMWVVLLVCAMASSVASAAELKMAIFPRRPPAATMKMFKPLAKKLSQELGNPVKLVISKDFPTFWKGVASKKFDIVHFGPYHLLLAEKKFGFSPLVQNEEFNSNTLTAVIWARKDSGIKDAAGLKGKKIIFGGGKKALFAYIAPTYILRKAGLKQGDYKEQVAKNPFGAVIGAYRKAGDAGCASSITLNMPNMKGKVKAAEMANVGEVGPLPQLVWATGEKVDAATKEKLKSIFLGLKAASPKLLKQMKVTNFSEITDYTLLKEVVKVATGQEF